MARIAATLLTSTLILCGCSNESVRATSRPLVTVAPGSQEELSALYAAGVTRSLEALSVASRGRAEKALAEMRRTPTSLQLRMTTAGTPRAILAPGFSIRASDLGLASTTTARELADAFLRRYSGLWSVTSSVVTTARVRVVGHDDRPTSDVVSIEYQQMLGSIPVETSVVQVHVQLPGRGVIGVTGSFHDVSGVDARPVLDQSTAVGRVSLRASELVESSELVVWSAYRVGGSPDPHLTWRVDVRGGDESRVVFVSARDGAEIHTEDRSHHALRRMHHDLRNRSDYLEEVCQRWVTTYPFTIPPCPATCASCAADPRECATCTCFNSGFDPPSASDCESQIWRYDETTGCLGNGVPAGELDCDSSQLAIWDGSEDVYNYWATRFGRDSWDDAGAWLYTRGNVNTTGWGGVATFWGPAAAPYLAWASFQAGTPTAELIGHEFGHLLQYGTWTYDGSLNSPYATSWSVREHLADVHGHHYQGLDLDAGFGCVDDLDTTRGS